MSTIRSLLDDIDRLEPKVAATLQEALPGADPARYARLVPRLAEETDAAGDDEVWFASAPGRTELAGNHTDHNHGRVLAASISLDSIAAFGARRDNRIVFKSEGFAGVDIDLDHLDPHPDEEGSVASLVRGVASGCAELGMEIGGFNASAASRVLAGSGLSSSASVEVLIGSILNALYNGSSADTVTIARAGQLAENRHFGKPSGLLDQLGCASGGIVGIDFENPTDPSIEQIDVSFADSGLALLVVDTGTDHADLTDEYAAIPADMRAVARELSVAVLREAAPDRFYAAIPTLRAAVGDRAVARAIHFYQENERVVEMIAALRTGAMDDYLALMADSGRSSGIFLQNCAATGNPREQGVVMALAMTERYLADARLRIGRDAACRVHGGGFAGTIQVLLPVDRVASYRSAMEKWLAQGAVCELEVRRIGAVAFHA